MSQYSLIVQLDEDLLFLEIQPVQHSPAGPEVTASWNVGQWHHRQRLPFHIGRRCEKSLIAGVQASDLSLRKHCTNRLHHGTPPSHCLWQKQHSDVHLEKTTKLLLLPLMKPHKVWGEMFDYQKRYRLVCWDYIEEKKKKLLLKQRSAKVWTQH